MTDNTLNVYQPIEQYLAALEVPQNLTGLAQVNYMIQKHLSMFAFSSINVMLERELPLDIANIVDRIVVRKQGGYCFEHNKLMQVALAHLGYQVRPILARVLLDGNEYNRRSHRLTLLTLDAQEYAVDVGFGIGTPREALPLTSQHYQWSQTHCRLCAIQGQDYRVEQLILDNWQTMYRFDLSETTEADCDASHFYTHKFPQSNFVNNLVVSSIDKDKRLLVKRLELFEYDEQQGSETCSPIRSSEHLFQVIVHDMGLNFTSEEIEEIFEHQQLKAKS